GAAPELPDLPIQYADFVAWQQSEANRSRLDKELNYWRSRLGGELPRVQLPTDFPRPRKQTFNGAVVEFAITEATTQCLRELAREHAGSLFMVLVTALNVLLYRYSGQRDLCIGTPVANRQRAELEPLIGLFVNTLVLRTQVDPEQSFTGLLQQVRDTVLEAQAHQDVPFEHLVEALAPARDPSLSPLFQVKFRLENAPAENVQLPGLRLERQPQQLTLAKLDLSVDMYETSDGLVGGFEYNTDLFERATIERMASQFAELIARLVDEPGAPIGSIGALTAAELERQRFAWNANTETYADTSCYHQLFERAVAASPESLAVIHDGVAREQLTYDELNRRANRLAHHLIDRGAGPEAVVAICLPRSIDLVVAWLAVLKAGAAYLPLDPDYPADRLRFMLNDAGVRVLLTVSETALPGAAARVDLDRISIDDLPDDNPAAAVRPDNLAYLIYTSGSTGRPKGALIAHRGLVNLTEDKIRKCDVRAGDRVLQFFSFSFDGSVPEFVMTLAAGACLVAAPAASLLPGPGLRDLLLRNEITHMTLTPSALTALPYTAFPKLRMVLVGGEAPSRELIARWSEGRRFINAYGPTETTVNASMVPCGNGHPLTPTLTPSANKQLYVLDEDLQIVPVGAVGELHIGGVGLARGYLHQAALTAERFIPNPFALGPEDARSQPDDSVLYKSGDLASYLPDGRIRIIGRVDQQTKIRGFRIELGEIERVLEQHPHVDAGVVIARDHGDDKRLIAYGVASVDDPDEPAKVRRFVAEKLPQFMVPGALVWLPELPLTSNGKLDVDALPSPGGRAQRRDTSPRSPREELLAGLFAEIIGVDRVGIDENFFDLGGHSLLATRLVSRLLEQAGIEITVMDLFEAGSVAELAQRIEQKQYLDPLLGAIEDDDEREEVAL
ncbi:MAG: amino acid adenylation domain-containing protein, partial [Pseudomonadota bacterium]